MIGFLIIAHETLGDGLVKAVTHVLGSRPPQFEILPVTCDDDPTALLPAAREAVTRLDTGAGVVVFSDIFGATPCNLATRLWQQGRVEILAGVNLPMLVRAFTYRNKDLETVIRKAVSGGCEGVLQVQVDPSYAATRS